MGMGTQPTTNHQQPPSNTQQTTTLKMKSLVTVVFFNIALARPDHGVVHHGAHHTVHHQPATVHHAVHSVHQPVLHHAVHHNAFHHQPVHQPVAPVVAKVAPKTLAELVVSEPRFSTLLAAVKAADLVDTLNGEGAFTVFAPTNEAFKKVPEDALAGLLANKELKKVLLRHVVPSTIQGKNIPPGTTTLTAASGDKIDVTRDQNNLIQIKSTAG